MGLSRGVSEVLAIDRKVGARLMGKSVMDQGVFPGESRCDPQSFPPSVVGSSTDGPGRGLFREDLERSCHVLKDTSQNGAQAQRRWIVWGALLVRPLSWTP